MGINQLRYGISNNSLPIMQSQAERRLNPFNYYLSKEAKKRLKWLYLLYYEFDSNVSLAAKKIGLSREWLSKLKSKFEKSSKNPRSLEPKSKAPRNTNNRERIPEETEEKILKIRDKYGWGKEDISVVLWRDYHLKACPSTVNRYLHKHARINPKISERNQKAWLEKKIREDQTIPLVVKKYRPPSKLKDYAPGALMEKDMKLVPTIAKIPKKFDGKYHLQDHFNYQHTFLDSFTRVKAMELSQAPDSQSAKQAYEKIEQRLPFKIGSINTDSGGENGKDFKERVAQNEVIHFYSKTGTPTDNPRVERSHLTDDKECWGRGNGYLSFEKQKQALKNWEWIYNYVRPNQALGYLTPMEFYQLWKENPAKAYAIKDKYQIYLKRQRIRLAKVRKIKSKEQIEKVMQFIDAKLNQKVELKPYKLELIKCELCSWT
jgi:transposase InsO family protein